MTKKDLRALPVLLFASVIILSLCSLNAIAAVEEYTPDYLNGKSYLDYINKVINAGYSPEVFTKIDRRNMERVEKQRVIEDMLRYTYSAAPISSFEIDKAEYLRVEASNNVKQHVLEDRQQREKNASANGEFSYVTYTDQGTDYFKDGLLSRSLNRKQIDELGNMTISSTYDMKYNDDRLLVSYGGDRVDNLGNKTTLSWEGSYLPGSLFYANPETRAYKSYAAYTVREKDAVGNTKDSYWKAVSYDPSNKFQLSYNQKIEDSVYGTTEFTRSNIQYATGHNERPSYYSEKGVGADGLPYESERKDITYNGRAQITFFDDTTKVDYSGVSAEPLAGAGNIVTTHTVARFQYREDTPHPFGPDVESIPLRIGNSRITTGVTRPDGSKQNDDTTTSYVYDPAYKLVDAGSKTAFQGQGAKWFEYKDSISGEILSKKEDGTYFYRKNDQDVVVSADKIVTTLKDGDRYFGESATQMEILYGKPMAKNTESSTSFQNAEDNSVFKVEKGKISYQNSLVHNFQRMLSTAENSQVYFPYLDPDRTHIETSNIFTAYAYNSDTANLVGVKGTGEKSGWLYSSSTDWHDPYTNSINREYKVILGKPVMVEQTEEEKK